MKRVRKTTLALSVSAALFMAAAAPIGAQTDLTIENDGLTLTAGAVSSEQILSMKLRIIGPNGFVHEERLEDAMIQWVPKGELADGVYHWEVTAVTAQPGAPRLDVSPPAVAAESDPEGLESSSESNIKASPPQIPAERFYADEFKSVERTSGSFLVRDGWIEARGSNSDSLSSAEEPGVIGSIAGAVIDFVFPSARAAECGDPCTVTTNDTNAEVQWIADNDGNSGGPFRWEIETFSGGLDIGSTTGNEILRLQDLSAPSNSLVINSAGDIGISTSAPTAKLHMADNVPAIRYEDLDGAQQWTLLAGSAGYRVVDDTASTTPFLIEQSVPTNTLRLNSSGFVGIGTGAPANDLTIASSTPTIRLVDVGGSADWEINSNGQSTVFDIANVTAGTSPFRIESAAPTSTLVLDSSGGVGIGTAAPQDKLHIRATDGTAGILLQETSAIATNTMLEMQHNGNPGFQMENTGTGAIWQFRLGGSGGSEQFSVNKVGTGQPEASFVANGNLVIAGSLIEGSSREIKQDIAPVDADDLLSRLEALDVVEWSYTRSPGNRHVGPMAEEFYELFGLGKDDKTIFPRDLAGIALAAAKEVHLKNRELERRNLALEHQNRELVERLERVEAKLDLGPTR